MITIFTSDYIGSTGNCVYSHKVEVDDLETLKKAVSHDYVCAEYKENYRNVSNFIISDCLPFDCDNTHSENPSEWVTPETVKDAFPNTKIYVHYSRSHMKEKGGKAPRPKFHVFFEIEKCKDASTYKRLKEIVLAMFPFFDTNASDSARFFFGTADPKVEIIDGDLTVNEFIEQDDFDTYFKEPIKEGSRNNTMSRFASRVIKKYGDTDEAYDVFLEKSKECEPPLEDEELRLIWSSARKFYKKISQSKDYIEPDKYNDEQSYKPNDYTDVGQAEVLSRYFQNELRYSPHTHFIRYKDGY